MTIKEKEFKKPRPQTRTTTMFLHRAKTSKNAILWEDKRTDVMPNFDRLPPILNWGKVAPEESETVSHLSQLLTMLNYYVRCFEADVQLYETAAHSMAYARDEFEKNK